MLAYNEFAYKKTNDHYKLEDRFQKKGHFSITITDKKTAFNEGRLYSNKILVDHLQIELPINQLFYFLLFL